jgi:hypothetical protein
VEEKTIIVDRVSLEIISSDSDGNTAWCRVMDRECEFCYADSAGNFVCLSPVDCE